MPSGPLPAARRSLTAALLVSLSAGAVSAQATDWIGTEGNWEDPLSWSGGVPTALASARIEGGIVHVTQPGAEAFYVALVNKDLDANGTHLYVEAGATLHSGGALLGFRGDGPGSATVRGAGAFWETDQLQFVGQENPGTLNVLDGGTFIYNGSGATNGTWVGNFSDSAVNVSGVGSSAHFADGLFVGVASGTGQVNVTGGASLTTGTGPFTPTIGFAGGAGLVEVSGAGSSWTHTGDIDTSPDVVSSLEITDGGLVDISGELDISDQMRVTIDGGTLNAGLIRLSDSRPGTFNGDLDLHDGGAVSATTIDQQAGQVRMHGGTLTIEQYHQSGGRLEAVSPNYSTPTGTVHLVGGDYHLSGGVLSLEMYSATVHERAIVDGDITITGGNLRVAGLNTAGGTPSPGDRIDVLDFTSITGEFDKVVGFPGIDRGWDTTDLYTTGELIVIGGFLPGDANGDGVVSTPDIQAIIAGWNLNVYKSLRPDGDLNGDGLTDVRDVQVVIINFGRSLPAPVNVPEPGSLALLGAAGLALLRRRRVG